MKFSNPSIHKVVEDWPYGSLRTKAVFLVEGNNGKQRAVRVTIDPKTGRETAPKKRTYAHRIRFAEGEDGRIYVLEDHGTHISVIEGTMKFQKDAVWHPTWTPDTHPDKQERDAAYNAVAALFET